VVGAGLGEHRSGQSQGLPAGDTHAPWHARAAAIAVVAYALSPIGLGPDVIPVRGHLADRMLMPLGVVLAARLLPREMWAEAVGRPTSVQAPGRITEGAVPPARRL